ncbi:MAG: PLP-dependent transferase, partial [Pseudomonadota bacterium]
MTDTPQKTKSLDRETFAVQAGGKIDPVSGAIIPAIEIATTFERDADLGYSRGSVYGRADNQTVAQCEHVITALEGGAQSLIFSSGMAAATAFFLALERPCHVVAPRVMYWSLRNWLINEAPTLGLDVTFLDASDAGAVADAIRPGATRAVWLETPANPLWTLSDIAAIAAHAKQAGACVAVDSTAASPVVQQPLTRGADVVMHAATKYLNGHSDVVAGSLTFAHEDALMARARTVRASYGAILGPFEAALLLRGMRTLFVRVARQCETAAAVARAMSDSAEVAHVLYPGVATGSDHDLARQQMPGGFGGMLSLRCAGGRDHAVQTAARLGLIKRATSLGGVETLIEHRASIEGEGTPCPDDLLRLSIGLEPVAALIDDLRQA